MTFLKKLATIFLSIMLFINCEGTKETPLFLPIKDSRIVLLGNNLASRMDDFGSFETALHIQFPDSTLYVRNISSPGNTPGFRPHPSRTSPWAFEGADQYNPQYDIETGSEGHFPTEDEWIKSLRADIILAFFGYNESFRGPEGLEAYREELAAFLDHSTQQAYNEKGNTKIVLLSPIAFEDLSKNYDLPDGKTINKNLKLYTEAMRDVAKTKGIPFIDLFTPSEKWYKNTNDYLTIDGSQLNEEGYKKLGDFLVERVFGKGTHTAIANESLIKNAVIEKNWMWKHDFKIPNGVHAYGRRFNPFGPENYPFEVAKIKEMTANRDTAIWKAALGEVLDLDIMDKNTMTLPEIKTNYNLGENGNPKYLYGQEALDNFHLAPGYKIELFASEVEFPDLANPMQLSFDNKGRLWVAVMPSYPHWKPGDGKPNDKILIFEDTNGDGKADKQTVFAENLHLPIGFEFAPEGVYVSQSRDMVLLKDTDGDGKADSKEVILSGFDDHDTHHAHSAYTTDPSGAIYMSEGVFLHTNVETSYGPVRGTNGGFYRYSPQNKKLERVAQLAIPNPWGIAFDKWGQIIYAETSGPAVRWMLPGTIKPRYGEATDKSFDLIDPAHQVRPTSGLEFVSSSHFPDDVQGDFLINNTIGFLGTKQHKIVDDGTGYHSKHRQDLLRSDDPNFRPVDMEFAPDGSLYVIDWHNALIGHMQHNARDPLRDHVHGRIYRITYPSRPLVVAPKIEGATIEQLLENLKLPEYRARYRTRAELRTRKAKDVIKKTHAWVNQLEKNSPDYEQYILEALWVTWGMNEPSSTLLEKVLNAKDYKIRSAGIGVLRYSTDKIANYKDLFTTAAQDEHGRVKLSTIAAASWLPSNTGLEILNHIDTTKLDRWSSKAYETAFAHLNNRSVSKKENKKEPQTDLQGSQKQQYIKGAAIFARDGFCQTCHQADGKGLESSGFPPISKTRWVTGNEDRLIKLTINGLMGPIEIEGKKYPGQVPMTPFGGMLNDQEIADVLTYVRNSFGNRATAISPEKVKEVRAKIKNKKGFYSPEELLKDHPMEN